MMLDVEFIKGIWDNLSTKQLIDLEIDYNVTSLKEFSKFFKGYY